MIKTQVEIEIFIWDSLNKKLQKLEREELETILVRILENGNLAANAPSYEHDAIIFTAYAGPGRGFDSKSSAASHGAPDKGREIQIAFSEEFAQEPEISPYFKCTEPGGTTYTFYSTHGTHTNAAENPALHDALKAWAFKTKSAKPTDGYTVPYKPGAVTKVQFLLMRP
jgi:hypothetical protein